MAYPAMTAKSEQRILLEALTAAINAMTPAVSGETVTPSDGADLPNGTSKALYVGTAGNISVILENDTNPVTFVAVSGWLPLAVKRVRSTGNSASDIVAIY